MRKAKKITKGAPRERVAKPRKQTLRTVLDQIDKVLVKKDQLAIDLWSVLSALRGPDVDTNDSWQKKENATVPIRRAAFPKTANSPDGYQIGASFGWPGQQFVQPEDAGEHFDNHVMKAATALGLMPKRT